MESVNTLYRGDALQTALTAERAAAQQAEARASGAEAIVAYLKLLIAKMKRERFGQSAERGRKLFDQLELQLEELEASATEDIVAAGPVEPDPLRLSAGHSFPLSPFIRLGVSANNLCRSQVAAPISSSTSSVSPGSRSSRQKRAAPTSDSTGYRVRLLGTGRPPP